MRQTTLIKLITFLVFISMHTISISGSVRYTLEGNDSTFKDGNKIFLWSYYQNMNHEYLDSAIIRNHSFRLTGETPYEHATVIVYMGESLDRPQTMEQLTSNFVVENGDMILERVDSDWFQVKGSPTNDRILSLSDSLSFLDIKNEKNGIMSLFLLDMFSEKLKKTEVEQILSELPEDFSKNPSVEGWRHELDAWKADVGEQYVDITGTTIDGDTISLSSIVNTPGNRYVIVDFGAGWCRPCHNLTKELAPRYEELKSKGIDIFGISYDASKEGWQKYIDQYEMKWPHINFGFGVSPRETKAWKDYHLTGIPSIFIIDCTSGTIISKGYTHDIIDSL